MTPPMLRFGQEMVGWTGPWPPPERMWRCTGKQTGEKVYTNPDERTPHELRAIDIHCTIEKFVRASYSQLPESVDDHPHVFRGAEYVLEDQSAR